MGAEAMGLIGVLTVAVRGAAGPGQVLLPIAGGREAYFAESAEPIAKGATVLVIATAPHRHVTVVPWTPAPV